MKLFIAFIFALVATVVSAGHHVVDDGILHKVANILAHTEGGYHHGGYGGYDGYHHGGYGGYDYHGGHHGHGNVLLGYPEPAHLVGAWSQSNYHAPYPTHIVASPHYSGYQYAYK